MIDADADDDGADWAPVFTSSSTLADLEAAIAKYTAETLADLRAQLEADSDLTEAERAHVMSFAGPRIRRQTRAALTAGYDRLRPVH
jgi:hypothetical protein